MVQGTGKMVRLSECLSYRGFELWSNFCEKVLEKVRREFKNSLIYWKFELSEVRVIGSVLQFCGYKKPQNKTLAVDLSKYAIKLIMCR